MKNKSTLRKSIRNIFVIANGMRKNILGCQPGKRVIAIHDVTDRSRFMNKMQWLKTEYDILPIDQLLTSKIGDKTQLSLTFDDGYSSWHEHVVPVLEELNIPATFFICSGLLGLKGNEARDFMLRYLKRTQTLKPLELEQLESISSNDLFDIGGHTIHHLDLGREYDSNTLKSEIIDDMKRLQDLSRSRVRWFAYPFGGRRNVCAQSKRFLIDSGYEGAFTIIPGFISADDDRYELNRDSLDIFSSDLLWKQWISGGYDIKNNRDI